MRGHPENDPDWKADGYRRMSDEELDAEDAEFDNDSWGDEFPREDEETAVVECPNCGEDVYEESEQCPSCGGFIVHSTSYWNDKPLLWRLMGVLGIGAVIFCLLGFALM